jgi:hypothetical protein
MHDRPFFIPCWDANAWDRPAVPHRLGHARLEPVLCARPAGKFFLAAGIHCARAIISGRRRREAARRRQEMNGPY